MPNKPNTTIAKQLNTAQLAIANSLADTEISTAVAEYGYTTTKLNAGMVLYQTALTAVNAQAAAKGDQKAATADTKAKQKIARDAYQAAAKVARATLSADDLTTLGLVGSEPRDTAGFIQASYTLFDNAAAGNLLSDFGYNAARLTAERAKITAFSTANQTQELAIGTAQQATQDQDAALRAMNDWTAQYLKIAKVALRDQKQLLEKIGVTTRTTKTAAQRAARKKKVEESGNQ